MEQRQVYEAVWELITYGLERKLIEPEDERFMINAILETMGRSGDGLEEARPAVVQKGKPSAGFDETRTENRKLYEEEACRGRELAPILETLVYDAAERGILDGASVTERDLFDTKLMGRMTPWPSRVIRTFWERYEQSPEAATDYFYQFSQDTNYIRRDRVRRDWKWKTQTPYGEMDITINLSKPEKDPKAIAAARLVKQGGYPKCLLCPENEGYAGRMDHPARQNHRVIPVTVNGTAWGLQYSPYVYYNEHCIVFNQNHTPMAINRDTFEKLLDFVRQFPHYFVGSNADLPIVGGSILSHDHFQGGRYEFAMAKAPVEREVVLPWADSVSAGIVRWPMSVLRLSAKETEPLVDAADRILSVWRGYSDEAVGVYAETDGEPHNTITPIARKRNGQYELDLVLRNNRTTKEHPLGVFHPHEELHHIKKENIGLIEVMGLAVLPARLKWEMELVAECLVNGTDLHACPETEKHADWAGQIRKQYGTIRKEEVWKILHKEIGLVFSRVLEDAGVFKRDEAGRQAFLRFTANLKK